MAPESFHAGEVALQREIGDAERMARIGQQVIRGYMPEQHRAFFPLLPFLIAGSVDEGGQPAASLLAAPPGFATSPDSATLRVDALPLSGDPLQRNLRVAAPLGLLGIQLHTRRRNRLNGIVIERDLGGFSLDVRQSFGNCPKYIHPRRASYAGSAARGDVRVSEGIDAAARALIASADTFFVASAHPSAGRDGVDAHGADVSHRGGPPGFIHFTDDATFSIPDYQGNHFFNTLGNIRLEPRVGLLFLDVAGGDLLSLEATAELLHESHPCAQPNGTGRCVRFLVERSRHFERASPLRFEPAPADP
jgi:uncharacterized protein